MWETNVSKRLTGLLTATALSLTLIVSAKAQDAAAPQTMSKDAILILDASGSMWGQIDGINKIVIAKDTVESLVRSLPPEQRLGMVAYGHRKKGDCGDIQTIADVGADRDDVIKQIRGLSPKGKTPLSKSVEHAADELNYKKNAATVILVSDGLETCSADPCALAKKLEENGLDFTVHVVGFDVTEEERKGLVCIAEETGGAFLSADNAEELTQALTQVAMITEVDGEADPVAPETAPKPLSIGLYATMLKGGPDIQRDVNWTITDRVSGDVIFEKQNTGYIDLEMVPGDYTAQAVWTGWPHKNERVAGDKTGTKDFTIAADATRIAVPIDLGIPVVLETDAEIIEGQAVKVRWSGPDDLGAYITTNALDDGPRDQIYSSPAQRARDTYQKESEKAGNDIDTNGDGTFNQDDMASSQVGGPSLPGEYEIRYVLASPRLILARKPLSVLDNPHTLSAPDSVPASSEFTVEWTGETSRQGDFLVLVEIDDKGRAKAVTPRVILTNGEPATMRAAPAPGDYVIQYVLDNGYTTYAGMDNAVQETRPITVTAVGAVITAPDTAIGGSTIALNIELPDGWEDDGISVIEPGAVKTNSDSRYGLSRVRQDDGSFSIRIPAKPGEYEIAYFLNPGAEVITRRPLTIEPAQAAVDAPATIKIGEAFDVAYSGDGFAGDRIVIAPSDVEDSKMWGWGLRYGFAAEHGQTSGTVEARRTEYMFRSGPGEYTVRYVTGKQHLTLARDSMIVTD